jgi:transglutaminase-like putative cysteine protease
VLQREVDAFGNHVVEVSVAQVEATIDFTAWSVVERDATLDPARLACADPIVAHLAEPSPLTMPDDRLRAAAARLQADGPAQDQVATTIMHWVHDAMTYRPGITGVRTTAAEALALAGGVCQDFAQVMLALCRLCGLPARYVSGHLLGEGGTHAWVEVLLPDPADEQRLIALPLDPTHGRAAGLSYVTTAVGRDYRDVAPTSGTFRAPYAGRLSAYKRAGLTALDYAEGR